MIVLCGQLHAQEALHPSQPVESPAPLVFAIEAIESAPVLDSSVARAGSRGNAGSELLLYEITLAPGPSGVLQCSSIADFGWVFLNGTRVGVFDYRRRSCRIRIPERTSTAKLEILVEAINATSPGRDGQKGEPGIGMPIHLSEAGRSESLTGWKQSRLALDPATLSSLNFGKARPQGPTFWRAFLELTNTASTFLDMRSWGKGCVWVNGQQIGSFWNIGPEQTLAVPAGVLRIGRNEIVVLDLLGPALPVVSGVPEPVLSEPRPQLDFSRSSKRSRRVVEPNQPPYTGEFSSAPEWQDAWFGRPARGRFFSFESLSSHDERGFAVVSELELLDEAGAPIPRDGWTVVEVDSEELTREDGSAENAIDGQPETFWHSEWDASTPSHPHRIILDLGKAQSISGFRYLPRPRNGGSSGRIKAYSVAVGNQLVERKPPLELLPQECFLFSHFGSDDKAGLNLSWSIDGYRWNPVNNGQSVLSPNPRVSPLFRDPCLLLGPDGTFHLVWTMEWRGNAIGYASSRDLIKWSEPRALRVMAHERAVVNCWAPEVYWDAEQKEFLLIWSSTVTNRFRETVPTGSELSNDRLYSTTTRDFRTFSRTRLFYDPGFGLIDPSITSVSNRFLLFFKDNTARPPTPGIRIASAEQLGGPYGSPSRTVSPLWVEGPTVFEVDNEHVLYFRHMLQNRFGAMRSRDLTNWDDVSDRLELPPDTHQGTVLRVPRDFLVRLSNAGLIDVGPGPVAIEVGLGNWIWAQETADKQTCRFWRRFDVPHDTMVSQAILRITADNGYRVWLNGREVGRGGDLSSLTAYNLSTVLNPGPNVLAVEAFNDAANAGVIFGMQIRFSNGKSLSVLSDPSWLVVPRDVRKWERRMNPRSDWLPARVVAFAGKQVWQRPERIITSPPITQPEVRFWQTGWFLSLLLAIALLILVVSLWLGLQLVTQRRSHRLLQRERERIARDIHDDLGAGLTQLTLSGELLLRDVGNRSEIQGRLDHLCDRARSLLGTLDEIIWVVNPKLDTVTDFAAFVSEHTQEFLRPTAVQCRLEIDENLPTATMDLPARRNLLLAIKEALRNVATHSHASELTLRIRVMNQELKVTIEDNGRGFSLETRPAGRNGLNNMRDRLADAGGRCDVTSTSGRGTTVMFSVPLNGTRTSRWSVFGSGFRLTRHK